MNLHYSNKTRPSLKSATPLTMPMNPNSTYQNLTPQLCQQQPPHLQRQHEQEPHQLDSALPHATHTNSVIHNASNLQGVSGSQQNPWSSQQTNYLPPTQVIYPTLPAEPVLATSGNIDSSWSQKSQVQDIFKNSGMQQHTGEWPQSPPQASAYDNYCEQQANNNMYQQQPPVSQQKNIQQNSGTYFQQQLTQTSQNQANAVNFFDQSNNIHQVASADGWGDWEWNDNSTISLQPSTENGQPQNTISKNNALADSFNIQNNNETWNWDSNENHKQVPTKEVKTFDNTNPMQNYNLNWNNAENEKDQLHHRLPERVPPGNEEKTENCSLYSIKENPQNVAATHNLLEINNEMAAKPHLDASPPPPPPPTEFSSSSENHNYNTNSSLASPNNIPNTVFVTQAKPVTLPPRQYASPASGNTPTMENLPETALMPPQGFQNVEEYQKPAVVASPPIPPPADAIKSANIMPPPTVLQSSTSKTGNPFKRSGTAQHHRATGLVTNTSTIGRFPDPAAFNLPPPPPSDFANPNLVNLMEPDNNELPSVENQEVVTVPTSQMSLTNVTMQSSAPNLFSNNTITPAPPNDERNQYLQTSHLSENSEEQQPEIDGQLPPPGLSRLVLGEPELEASQQRMVMGTEAPNADNAVTQAAVMHLEERHADGEDTASENATLISSVGQVPPTSTLSADRNFYMVPGESNNPNNNAQQRVVTGVELAEQREIEMDGENLEDEQIQQQQHTQNQFQHSNLSADSRNEPPVEGADDTVAVPPTLTTINTNHVIDPHLDQKTHPSTNQLSKVRDTNTISSQNDDEDSDERLLNDRVINQNTAGSSKSRTKYENDRLGVASRRRDKRTSVERYESDEYLNSEGEYSSEREERARRERDRRRNYREGSVRSDRGVNDDKDLRSRRHRVGSKHDKYYYEGEERSRGRDERERDGPLDRSKAERRSQRQHGYEADSRYETEESTRFESRKDHMRRSTRRNEAEYDDYNRRGAYRSSKRTADNYESDRRDRRRSDKHREPRYKEDPRYDPREYEDYRKHSSRNARDSDAEKEGAAPVRSSRMHHDPRHPSAAAMYGYSSGGYYDPYTAYYYQQMARTNPQAYAEWYKKYYGQAAAGVAQNSRVQAVPNTGQADLPASGNDGRESVHSGRSSAHNDVKDRSGAVSLRDTDPITQEPHRLTPCKFVTEHTVVNFDSGILVTVKPKYTSGGSISNIVKLLKFKPNDETRKLFKVFPGPLVRGLTHKKTVIEFCQEQIRLGPAETTIYAKQLITHNVEKYRGSYTLMWNLLILLLKQNGMVVGTDIAELLLKNQQEFPFQTPLSTANNSLKSKSGSNSPIEDLDLTKDPADFTDVPTKATTLDHDYSPEHHGKLQDEGDQEESSLTKSSSNSTSLTENEVTEKFRNFLLYGNVNEALEWATDNNLWGHALFLASKLDRRSHANVMMKFANKLSLNDPLQTLYQLMSGRTPSSVTCVQDEKWGDWRPHLSMILSNTSQKPELDRKSITTLGDSLFNRGDLYAAHFCYLMAQVGFGRYQETATLESSLQQHLPKLVLLGSSHYKQFKNFSHNESIIMTEIYEYACSLNDDKFSIVEFQPYKFLLATRLLDYGFHLKSLMYLEQTAEHIARDPSKYENSFISKVYNMADRLKYYDPVLEKTIDDQQGVSDDNNGTNLTSQQVEEQQWLQNLRQLAQNHKVDTNAPSIVSNTVSQDLQQPQLQEPSFYNQQQQIDQQFMEINKQFSELNLQYQQPTTWNTDQQQQPNVYNFEQQQQLRTQPSTDLYQQPIQSELQQSLQTELSNQGAKDLHQSVGGSQLQSPYQQQQQYLQPEIQSSVYKSNYYDPSQYNTVGTVGSNLDNPEPTNYDYWGQQQQSSSSITQLTDGNARPTISMPKSKTYDTDEEASAKMQQQQSHADNRINDKQVAQQQQQQQKGVRKEDASGKNQQQLNQNSGWFGGIWNKFSLKPKNQMILPDDKNPSIVWDPEKKKWINTDGDENEQEAFKPPPKISDLLPQTQIPPQEQQIHQTSQIPFMDLQQMPQQQPQLHQSVNNSINQAAPLSNSNMLQQPQNLDQSQLHVPGPSKTPTLQSNMFKMQRNRTLKNAYVDVFNPSGAPVNKATENILAPALPPATVPQSGFFIPGQQSSITSNTDCNQEQQYQEQQLQQQDTFQFYNPNQFTGGPGGF